MKKIIRIVKLTISKCIITKKISRQNINSIEKIKKWLTNGLLNLFKNNNNENILTEYTEYRKKVTTDRHNVQY